MGSHRSLDAGSVRLTERFGDDVEALAATVREVLPDLAVSQAIGVAGTVANLASLDLGLPEHDAARTDGHRLPLAGVAAQVDTWQRCRSRIGGRSPGSSRTGRR